MSRTKEEAIKIVVSCAERYNVDLNKKSMLFLCLDRHKRIASFEVSFHSWNYLHLTGLRPSGNMTARRFYERCLDHSLSPHDFDFAEDGTTELKLDVLPHVICKNLKANSIGDFDQHGLQIVTEKLVGGQKACLGFKKGTQSDEYIANTLLKGDIRDFATNRLRIIAAFRKEIDALEYQEITYLAKGIDWDSLTLQGRYGVLIERIQQELQPATLIHDPINIGQSV